MGGSALFYGMEQSLRLLCRYGIDKIEAYLAELTDMLCEIVSGLRYRVMSSRSRSAKSQIVSIRPEGERSCESVLARLKDEKVVVSSRGGSIRVAPHFFNNASDIERFAACLP
jgi:selenocysteine lyase/cysteine desulfurase